MPSKRRRCQNAVGHPTKQNGAPDQGAPLSAGEKPGRLAGLGHVLRCGTFLALDNVELNSVAFGEGLESRASDRAVVNEAILLPVVRGDEPKALRIVEPLHLAGRTHSLLLVKMSRERNYARPSTICYAKHNAPRLNRTNAFGGSC